MKFKFNLKLTTFLVSLFIALLLLILGNKNQYCLSFGFCILAVSMVLFVFYSNEKINKALMETAMQIEDTEPEDSFTITELYVRQTKLNKRKKSINFCFYAFALFVFIMGIIGLF